MTYMEPGNPIKRLRLFFVGVVVLSIIFSFKLVEYQFVRADEINKVSLASREVTRTVPAARGQIYDTNGLVLAKSVFKYDINVAPINVKPVLREVNGQEVLIPVEQVAAELAAILDMSPADVLVKITGTTQYANVKKRVDADAYAQLKKLDIPWVFYDAIPSRVYPSGAVAGSLLGFLSTDGKPLGGIESEYNSCLAGVDGKESFEKGEDGIKIPSSAHITQSSVKGKNVHLTINADLQYYAQQVLTSEVARLRADWATAVVIEVKTGKILVAAEAPTMDPNDPSKAAESARHARVFETAFEPGSVIKTLTASTLIDSGLGDPEMRVVAPFAMTLPKSDGYRVTDSHTHGDDKLTLTGVLRDSSNTGIMLLGQKASTATRYSYLEKYGIGKKTALGFPGESSGQLPKLSGWDNIKKYVSMFGQGFSVTPLQSAMAYQAIANGGIRLQPQLVEGCEDSNGNLIKTQQQPGVRVISADSARTTIDMLEKVVEQGGIGRHAAVPGYRVGGKTGTAEIIEPSTGRYGNLHAISFIGLAPAENPQFVVAVTAFKSRTVSNSFGITPSFKRIMEQTLRTYRVAPSTTKSANIKTTW